MKRKIIIFAFILAAFASVTSGCFVRGGYGHEHHDHDQEHHDHDH